MFRSFNLAFKIVALVGAAVIVTAAAIWAAALQQMVAFDIAAILIPILVCAVAGFVATRLFSPLRSISRRLEALAEGDVSSAIAELDRGDEIGGLARSFEILRQASARARAAAEERQEIERGEVQTREKRDGAIHEFRRKATDLIASLTTSTHGMRNRAEAMSDVSTQSRGAIGSASHSSHEASANVQTVASAAEELSASIAEIAGQLDRAKLLAERALGEAETTDSQIGNLARAAQRIGDVVDLIRSIAEQTNLLALNATIEAARAGEAGRGFAVVASEVKTLATQTAKATEEISKQISHVQVSTAEAVDAIRRMTGRMREINETTVGIAASVVQQGSATEEISRNVAEAARGTQDMAQGIGTLAVAAERTAEAAGTVTEAAQAVDIVAASLQAEIEHFLARVAA